MADQSEVLFEAAVASFGDPYRSARDELVSSERDLDDLLDKKKRSGEWQERLVADIVSGRRRERVRYEFIRQVAEGTEQSLEPKKYLTGRPPIDVSVEALLPLGVAYAPALLEMLYKEHPDITDYAFWVASNTLVEWQASRAVPVYRAFLREPAFADALRERSVQILLSLGAENLFDDLQIAIDDAQTPSGLRATAASVLGRTDPARAFPVLARLLQDPDAAVEVRAGAATGLGYTQHADAAALLLEAYQSPELAGIRRQIIVALGELETESAADVLAQIQTTETDPMLLQMIDRKLEEAGRY